MKHFLRSVVVFVFALCLFLFAAAASAEERRDGGYYTLVDESGAVITMTARELDPGDRYIAADNRLFEVVRTEGDQVLVRFVETIELPDITGELLGAQVAKAEKAGGVVGIYHTHNDESYVPTSGTESKDDGRGDVLQVGKALAAALEEQGLTVYWSDNSHIPHDGQAYVRSRRTAVELLQKDPDTLIDVHRDATPPEVYEGEVEGVPVTKVRIVVGRQNQNREANLEYAKRLKAVADKRYPGIVEGIFDAKGNYNQDLGPKTILLEFGAHTNQLDHAKQAAEFFAKVIPAAAGLTPSTQQVAQEQIGSGASRSLVWMLVIFGVVGAVFLLVTKGKIGTLAGFFRREAGLGEVDDEMDDQR
ncbi:MAG TPA: stage II sporulation protein P [Limnochordia bacterium]|nr:stage II sporulation protein P [Limnochordia bacterium]